MSQDGGFRAEPMLTLGRGNAELAGGKLKVAEGFSGPDLRAFLESTFAYWMRVASGKSGASRRNG